MRASLASRWPALNDWLVPSLIFYKDSFIQFSLWSHVFSTNRAKPGLAPTLGKMTVGLEGDHNAC